MSLAPHAIGFTSPGDDSLPTGRIGVLLSHGFTGSPASINPWAQALAPAGYQLVVPRLPGHGTSWQEMNQTSFADWYQEIETAFLKLSETCDQVVVGGLSMGGCLVLKLAANYPDKISGVLLVNPAVSSTNKQLLIAPLLKRILPSVPGIGNDIKKPGMDEHCYSKVPLKALDSMVKGWKEVRAQLPNITAPVLLFHSVDDHVVDPSSAKIIATEIGSKDFTQIELTNSYHVATLDFDADFIFTESANFIAKVTAS